VLSAILTEPGKIELREIEVPEPSEGELLIKIKAALTCGTDLKAFIRGHSLIKIPGPFGHEFSGIVAGKGKGVSRFKTGDNVMAVHSAPCLNCSYCKRGTYNLCENITSSMVLGAFSEYILLPKHVVKQNAFKKPADLNFKEAAFLEPLSCVVHAMEPLNITRKDTIFIIGAGPIGLLHLMYAKTKGAKVLITGLEEDRLKTAKKLGAESAFHPSQATETVKEFTQGMGVDYVFECTGQPDIWETSIDFTRKGGTVIFFGGCRPGSMVKFKADRVHYDEITLKGAFHYAPSDVKRSYSLLKNRKIEVKKLISGTFPLEEITDVFIRLSKGSGIKYAVTP
jgi:L-iditol 2-dehydrogenase